MSLFDQACYTCGEPGHYAAQCPERTKKQQRRGEGHPPAPAQPPPRPRNEIADPSAWADRIRQQMGWERRELGRTFRSDREQALEQVARSRAARPAEPVAEQAQPRQAGPRDA